MRRMPELMQLDSVKSMIRKLPPNGTAGFARHSVNAPKPSALTTRHDERQACDASID